MEKKRKVGIIHGSDSDLPQMYKGLLHLRSLVEQGIIEVFWVDSVSQHRHTTKVEDNLIEYHGLEESRPDILIVGAGWAAHLPGCSDAYLRYTLKDDYIVVYAVAFEDKVNQLHTLAAELSITEVPGTQVVFKGIGEAGFLKACMDVTIEELPKVVPKKPPESHRRVLDVAILKAEKLIEDQMRKNAI